jgi:hypothetical protein
MSSTLYTQALANHIVTQCMLGMTPSPSDWSYSLVDPDVLYYSLISSAVEVSDNQVSEAILHFSQQIQRKSNGHVDTPSGAPAGRV